MKIISIITNTFTSINISISTSTAMVHQWQLHRNLASGVQRTFRSPGKFIITSKRYRQNYTKILM